MLFRIVIATALVTSVSCKPVKSNGVDGDSVGSDGTCTAKFTNDFNNVLMDAKQLTEARSIDERNDRLEALRTTCAHFFESHNEKVECSAARNYKVSKVRASELSAYCDDPESLDEDTPVAKLISPTAVGIMAAIERTGEEADLESETTMAYAKISVSPTRLDFGDVDVGGYSAKNVTVTNIGNTVIDDIKLSTYDKDFTILNFCKQPLAPNEACILRVVFRPIEETSYYSYLYIDHKGGYSSLTIEGYGREPY